MDDLTGAPAVVLAAVTIISPLLTAVFTQVGWSSAVKRSISFGVALVIAVVYVLVTGGVTDWSDIPVAVGVVFGLQQATYMLLVSKVVKPLEAATSKAVDTGDGKHVA